MKKSIFNLLFIFCLLTFSGTMLMAQAPGGNGGGNNGANNNANNGAMQEGHPDNPNHVVPMPVVVRVLKEVQPIVQVPLGNLIQLYITGKCNVECLGTGIDFRVEITSGGGTILIVTIDSDF